MNDLQSLLKKDQTVDDGKSEEHKLFHVYWEKIEKAEKSYASAERKRGRIVKKFQEELLPLEKAYCQACYNLIQELLSYLPKKSISKQDKTDLIHWIHEHLEDLNDSPFRGEIDVDAVFVELQKFERKLLSNSAAEQNMMKEMLSDLFNDEMDFGDELDAMFSDPEMSPEDFFESIRKKAEKSFEGTSEQVDDEDPFFDHDFSGDDGEEYKNNGRDSDALSDKTLTRLYKRLAQKLHPDRAENDEDRAIRHKIMLQVTEAKRTNDVFLLLRLVKDHGDAGDASFSVEQLEQIVDRLRQKLEEIRAKKRALKTEMSIDALIYKEFHGPSNKFMNQKFSMRTEELSEAIDEIESKISKISSVNGLKSALNLWRSQFRQWMF